MNIHTDPGSFHGGASPSRRAIDRRMRLLDIKPLDHATPIIRVGIGTAIAFLLLFTIYGLLAPISSAAVATGIVSIGGDKMVVQPESAGVISQVLVREGQAVRAGQPLVRLNPLRSGSQLDQAQAHQDSLAAAEARLVAERDGAGTVVFPAELRRRAAEPGVAAILANERAIFRRHVDVNRADRKLIAVQLASARAQRAATARQLDLINDELSSYRDLYDKGFARKTTVRSLERNAAQLQADRATGTGSVDQAVIQQRRTSNEQFMTTVTELGQVREQLAQLRPQLAVARYTAGQDVLRAPADGRVSGVLDLGPGMVIGGGKTLMELVPANRGLLVEARIKPTDVDDIRVGQPATLRFASVNPHGQTSFAGHVTALSPDRIGDGEDAYFRAVVTLDDPSAARKEGLALQPGLPASVNIKTKDRTLFGYLFSPLSDAISRALREE